MKNLILLVLFFSFLGSVSGQYTGQKKILYKATVQIVGQSQPFYGGYLLETRDSTFSIALPAMNPDYALEQSKYDVFHYSSIESLKLKRNNRGWRGFGYGVLIGAATGIVLGLADGDTNPDRFFAFTAGEKTVIGGVFLGATGGAVGTLVGLSSSVSIPLNGSYVLFDRNRERLRHYSFRK